MDDQFSQQLVEELLARVQERKFTQFHLLNNWEEFQIYRQSITSTKIVIKVLRTAAINLFKQYCRTVITGISDVNQLLAYTQLREAVTFYETELTTFTNAVDEYTNYLCSGNFWYAFTGGERF